MATPGIPEQLVQQVPAVRIIPVAMVHIVLFEPEIPPNTDNIIRLCANTGARLHLIHPLSFAWDDARLRRAGLDYHEWARVRHYTSFHMFLNAAVCSRLVAFSTKGGRSYTDIAYREDDALLFGPETRGLPPNILRHVPPEQVLRIPI